MAKRRANGEGNLRKQKDGRWEGRYTAGRDPETGRVIYKNVLGPASARSPWKNSLLWNCRSSTRSCWSREG